MRAQQWAWWTQKVDGSTSKGTSVHTSFLLLRRRSEEETGELVKLSPSKWAVTSKRGLFSGLSDQSVFFVVLYKKDSNPSGQKATQTLAKIHVLNGLITLPCTLRSF